MPLELIDTPPDPGLLLQEWIDDAAERSGMTNHTVMMLATVDSEGQPSVRPVLRKDFDPTTCRVTFYTNYNSRKALEIEANPRVSAVMHWDAIERQVRIDGRAAKNSAEVSDEYFASRARDSQVGAWASEQSAVLESFGLLIGRALLVANEYAGQDIPRPPHWGGYDIAPERIEFWQGGTGRIHQRVCYTKMDAGWTPEWLNP